MGSLGDFARFCGAVCILRLTDFSWRHAWQWNILGGDGSRIQLQEMIQTDRTAGVTDANTSYFIKWLKIYKIKKEPRNGSHTLVVVVACGSGGAAVFVGSCVGGVLDVSWLAPSSV